MHICVLQAKQLLLDAARAGLSAAAADAALLQRQLEACPPGGLSSAALAQALPAAERVAAALLDWWQQPCQRCANLAGCSGGPAAGDGVGS